MVDSYLAPRTLDEARARLEQRAAEAAAAGLSRIDLGPGEPHTELAMIERSATCVVSQLRLWSWAPDDLERLAALLHPDGRLLFLEPTADRGWRRIAHDALRSRLRDRLGYDFGADLPAGLRAAGLFVGTADRFGLGVAETRSYVWGVAEHIPGVSPGRW